MADDYARTLVRVSLRRLLDDGIPIEPGDVIGYMLARGASRTPQGGWSEYSWQ